MDRLEKDDERLEKDAGICCDGVDPVPPPIAADGVGKPANGTGEATEEGEADAGRGDAGKADAGAKGTPPGSALKPSGSGDGPCTGAESPGMRRVGAIGGFGRPCCEMGRGSPVRAHVNAMASLVIKAGV